VFFAFAISRLRDIEKSRFLLEAKQKAKEEAEAGEIKGVRN